MTMSGEESLSSSLLRFLRSSVPSIKVEDLDEILLDYVSSILEDLKEEDSSNFDLEEFYEMLVAYVPDSSSIPSETVLDWLLRTASERRAPQAGSSSSSSPKFPSLEHFQAAQASKEENKEEENLEEESEEENDLEREEIQEQIDSLSELFPYACQLEVVHCLSLSSGDIDKAAHLIMHRNETGQCFRAPTDRKIIKPNPKPKLNEKELKEKIVGKYGFIDQAEDSRYHRPTIKKAEDKKLIRYRDGKIVSTKGERFTQVSKDAPEEMKKSHVNIGPNI